VARSLKLSVALSLKQTPLAQQLAGRQLTVFAYSAIQPDKLLGKATLDAKGQGTLALDVTGTTPPALILELSPLTQATKFKTVITQKMTVKEWKKSSAGFAAAAAFEPAASLLASVTWLDEQFTIIGTLVNRFEDAETGNTLDVPIRDATVTMFEVDKSSIIGPCTPSITGCLPSKFCKPSTYCLPIIDRQCVPKLVCDPLTHCDPIGPGDCPPTTGPCGPWRYQECGPDFTDFDPGQIVIDPSEVIRQDAIAEVKNPACCGNARVYKSAVQQSPTVASVAKMMPLRSPALAGKVSTAISGILSKTSYSKTQLCDAQVTDTSGAFSFTFKRSDFFTALAGTTHAEDVDWDEWADLLFTADKWIDGASRKIYNEPYSATRWNIHDHFTYVTLVVEGLLPGTEVGPDTTDPDQPEPFLFHNVGDVEACWIDSNGVISNGPDGYGWNKFVFGGTLDLFAQFNAAYIGKYYMVEYSLDGSSWKPVQGESWYYSHYLGSLKWETLIKQPEKLSDAYPACYQIPNYLDETITRKTLLLNLRTWLCDGTTARYPNGLVHLRVQLLDKTATGAVPVAGFNPDTQQLTLAIDNTWPQAQIKAPLKQGSLSGSVLSVSDVVECGFVNRGANKYLLFNFSANDADKHFMQYQFTLNRGFNGVIQFPAQPLPAGVVTAPAIAGFSLSPVFVNFTTTSPDDNYPNAWTALSLNRDPYDASQPFRQCAYNFRLGVWDRVVNGYGLIHYSEQDVTLTVLAEGVRVSSGS
jgi:hypothetical protein